MNHKLRSKIIQCLNHTHFVPACVMLGIVVRLLWIVLVNPEQIYDCRWYLRRAITMANGGGYSFEGTPTAYWPVGYPAFLAAQFWLFGPSEFLAKVVNIL